jgi:hypothetical protein
MLKEFEKKSGRNLLQNINFQQNLDYLELKYLMITIASYDVGFLSP